MTKQSLDDRPPFSWDCPSLPTRGVAFPLLLLTIPTKCRPSHHLCRQSPGIVLPLLRPIRTVWRVTQQPAAVAQFYYYSPITAILMQSQLDPPSPTITDFDAHPSDFGRK